MPYQSRRLIVWSSNLLLVLWILPLVFGCQSVQKDSSSVKEIADIRTIIKRADGKFHVVCANGWNEAVNVAPIDNSVCAIKDSLTAFVHVPAEFYDTCTVSSGVDNARISSGQTWRKTCKAKENFILQGVPVSNGAVFVVKTIPLFGGINPNWSESFVSLESLDSPNGFLITPAYNFPAVIISGYAKSRPKLILRFDGHNGPPRLLKGSVVPQSSLDRNFRLSFQEPTDSGGEKTREEIFELYNSDLEDKTLVFFDGLPTLVPGFPTVNAQFRTKFSKKISCKNGPFRFTPNFANQTEFAGCNLENQTKITLTSLTEVIDASEIVVQPGMFIYMSSLFTGDVADKLRIRAIDGFPQLTCKPGRVTINQRDDAELFDPLGGPLGYPKLLCHLAEPLIMSNGTSCAAGKFYRRTKDGKEDCQ